ncbi:hypothetical protein AKJ16_DCAP23103 [Drosera capensis]
MYDGSSIVLLHGGQRRLPMKTPSAGAINLARERVLQSWLGSMAPMSSILYVDSVKCLTDFEDVSFVNRPWSILVICVFSYSLAMLFLNSILSGSSKFPTGHKSRCLTSELSLIVNTMIISCVKRFEVYSYRKDPSCRMRGPIFSLHAHLGGKLSDTQAHIEGNGKPGCYGLRPSGNMEGDVSKRHDGDAQKDFQKVLEQVMSKSKSDTEDSKELKQSGPDASGIEGMKQLGTTKMKLIEKL